jgi:hypothetical protein
MNRGGNLPADDVGKLMVGAFTEGAVSQETMGALTSVPEIGVRISEGLGGLADADFLVTVMPDDSFSIDTPAMRTAVRQGHNLVLTTAREQPGIRCLFHSRYLNGTVLNPYVPARDALEMTEANYSLSPGGTPLYDQSVVVLGTVLAKWRSVPGDRRPRTLSVLISDGADTTSTACTPADVKWIVSDMLMTGDHIVAAMGISDGRTDFPKVFGDMGVPEQWILTPDASPDKLGAAFSSVAGALKLAVAEEDFGRLLEAGPPTT